MDELNLRAPVTAWHVLLLPPPTQKGSQEEVGQLPTVWTWARNGQEWNSPLQMEGPSAWTNLHPLSDEEKFPIKYKIFHIYFIIQKCLWYLLIYIFDKHVQLYEKHMLFSMVGESG